MSIQSLNSGIVIAMDPKTGTILVDIETTGLESPWPDMPSIKLDLIECPRTNVYEMLMPTK